MKYKKITKIALVAVGLLGCTELMYRMGQGNMLGNLIKFGISPENAYQLFEKDERFRSQLITIFANESKK